MIFDIRERRLVHLGVTEHTSIERDQRNPPVEHHSNAIRDAVIGYFDPEKKAYLRNHEKGQAEVLSLTGNLALYDNEPFFHVHVALGLPDGSARGGHLFEATVRPTVELVLTTYAKTVRRQIDSQWNLPLLHP